MEQTGGLRFLQGSAGIILVVCATACACLGTGTIPPSAIPPSATPPQAAAPAGHPPHSLPSYYFSLYQMQKNLAPSANLSLPTYLPEGFFFNIGSQVVASGSDPGDAGDFWVTYRRGQEEEIALHGVSRNNSACPDTPVCRPPGSQGILTQKAGAGELSWGSDRWCFVLSGSLPRDELEKIAASVRPVPYREGELPPFEYRPPAHPLVRSFAMNRSATANGLTVTLRSLSCTADSCTATFRVGTAGQPVATPPPLVTTMPMSGSSPRAEWRVDGGRPLLTPSGGSMTYNATAIFWKIEPLPAGSRELTVNFSRVNGIAGTWLISVPLDGSADAPQLAGLPGDPS